MPERMTAAEPTVITVSTKTITYDMSFLIPFLILSMENLLYILCTQTGYPEICPQLLMAYFMDILYDCVFYFL